MQKISIIYWSGTGNTEIMAESIAEGAKSEGAEVKVLNVDEATLEDVFDADIAVLGCPSMGAENLEEGEMEPFMESLEDGGLKGKKIVLFGSYDWGDGQWMKDWEDRVTDCGGNIIETSLIINLTPEDDEIENCKELGRKIAKA